MTVNKKKVLNYIFQDDYKPLTFNDLARALKVNQDKEIQDLHRLLENMVHEGSLCKTPQGRYGPLRGMGMLTGILQGHQQGYAFLLPEAPGETDVFIAPEKRSGAMHKDRVMVRLSKDSRGGKRRQGEVVRILKRGNPHLVGTYQGNKKGGTLVPDDRHISSEIQIKPGDTAGAKPDQKVMIQITRWPDAQSNLIRGKVVEVIGSPEDAGVDITTIIRKYGLPSTFPQGVMKEAGRLDEMHIDKTARDEDRWDLRQLPMVTIDGEDAKDLDDAVSLEEKEKGKFRLGVHIADVSYYVREGSALDREASRRANSVYLPDRVIPMFPPQLSNGICSLNPQVSRLAVSVFIDLDEQGRVQNYEFNPSVIRVAERMTYDDVNAILEGDEAIRHRYASYVPSFESMDELAHRLKKTRLKRGALDFHFPEAKVKLNEEGKPVDIQVRLGSRAESIIEEFMLICNEVIAHHFQAKKVPFVYRGHESPDPEKLYYLRDFLSLFNIRIKGDLEQITPSKIQQILEEARGTRVERYVNYVLLRSMAQAHYSEQPLGHFGLAARHYTHFTSPIRRYPDLLVHRILRKTIQGGLSPSEARKLASVLPRLVQHASEQERVAMEAERECVDLKKVEFMEGKEGEEFTGIISGVTSFGFFVELENTVEGLVHVTRMVDDYYSFDETRYSLVGEATGKKYQLGDQVVVRLDRVNKEMRSVEFTPVSAE